MEWKGRRKSGPLKLTLSNFPSQCTEVRWEWKEKNIHKTESEWKNRVPGKDLRLFASFAHVGFHVFLTSLSASLRARVASGLSLYALLFF